MAFFEGFYQSRRLTTMKQLGDRLKVEQIESEEFLSIINECNEVGIEVYVYHNGVVYSTNNEITDNTEKLIRSWVDLANTNGEFYTGNDTYSKDSGLFYCAIKCTDNVNYVILTSSYAELKESISIIRYQFLYTSIIVLTVAVIMAWFLASRMSNPIDEMSLTAKKWADGDNMVTFRGDSHYAEINELAETLNYAKESVSKAGTLQRDLLANVSHDLKTPLTMIKAYAEMIRDISGDNKQKREKHTQVIMDEADRLTMLVNDILNLSKLQSSVDSLQMSEINLSELTERVIGRFAPYVENQGFTIENYVAPDLLTIVDEQKIEQVIYNLLGNSINYTGEDKVVKVYLTAEGDKIILEIIDSGKGISQEKLETIWERYYRFSETNTRPVKGTGLGLSIVKTILDAHHLRFGVRSKKDCGSNFFVEFNRVRNE
ncbi:MAG: HAMP domain-containing histidine kinase [Clostridia bacterium]|nr:HAMP domain-containing histidine kinase [Clostridia bacterium]